MISRNQVAMTAVFIAVAAVFTLHVRHYSGFLADDALISLRYASRFLDGKGLTWNDGERVEGYSNLLWILWVSLWSKLSGTDLVRTAQVSGFILTNGVLALLIFHREPTFRSLAVRGSAAAMLACSAPFAAWACAGLEQPLLLFLFAAYLTLLLPMLDGQPERRPILTAAVLGGWLALCRADALLLLLASIPFFILQRENTVAFRSRVWILLVPLIFTGAQVTFRLLYYGDWIPNTAHVKVAPSWEHAQWGWNYVREGWDSLRPFSLIGIACVVLLITHPRTRRTGAVLLLTMVVQAAYLILVGGDIFPAHRHWGVFAVLFAFSMTECLKAEMRFTTQRAFPHLILVAGMLCCIRLVQRQEGLNANIHAREERWEWKSRELASLLKHMYPSEPPLMAVSAAGSLPYWTGFPSIDMLGLNDPWLSRHKPPDFGKGMPGHELFDPEYLKERKPGLITFYPSAFGEDEHGKIIAGKWQHLYQIVSIPFTRQGDTAEIAFLIRPSRVSSLNDTLVLEFPGYLFHPVPLQASQTTVAGLEEEPILLTEIRPGSTHILQLGGALPESWTEASINFSENCDVEMDIDNPNGIEIRTKHSGPEMRIEIISQAREIRHLKKIRIRLHPNP